MIEDDSFYFSPSIGFCDDKRTGFFIDVIPTPQIDSVHAFEVCAGNDVVLKANSNDTLQWYTDRELNQNILTGDSIEIIDAQRDTMFYLRAYRQSCLSETDSILLTVNPIPNANFTHDLNLKTLSLSADLTGINLAHTWELDDTTYTGTELSRTLENKTTYLIVHTVIDTITGCESSEQLEITVNTGDITDLNINQGLQLYPNPSTGLSNTCKYKWRKHPKCSNLRCYWQSSLSR